MTALRLKVREAIRTIRENAELRWVLTRGGRAALRSAYRQGLQGTSLPLHDLFTVPLVVFYFIGVEDRMARAKARAQMGRGGSG